jgi:hypothetical protein
LHQRPAISCRIQQTLNGRSARNRIHHPGFPAFFLFDLLFAIIESSS